MSDKNMTEADMIWTATVAFDKNLDFEQLKYSDYMYGNEDQADDVWRYVLEIRDNGIKWFYSKYADFKLY